MAALQLVLFHWGDQALAVTGWGLLIAYLLVATVKLSIMVRRDR